MGAFGTTTVLVVDDEQNMVDLVEGYLGREGYRVLTAGDGPTALELARTVDPDVVVLDVLLPGLDGVEVCRRLRAFSDAYVLMLTARTEEVDKLVGIAPEHLPHVFERFYRVEKSRSRALGGSGIGLTIAKALVDVMGGRIRAESAGLGRGATFVVTLPAARDASLIES